MREKGLAKREPSTQDLDEAAAAAMALVAGVLG